MSRKEIPAKTITTCDLCGEVFSESDERQQQTIVLNGDCGNGSGPSYMAGKYDSCSKCYCVVVDMIAKNTANTP